MKWFDYLKTGCCVLLCTSCVHYFELNEVESHSKPVVYAYPGIGDTTFIHLSYSIPLNGVPQAEKMCCRSVCYTVEGQSFPVSFNGDNYCYVLADYQNEDEVKLEIETQAGERIVSETKVPPPFCMERVSMLRKGVNRDVLQFQLTFKDNRARKDYYALKVNRKDCRWTDGVYSEEIVPVSFDLKEEPLLYRVGALDAIFMPDRMFYENLYYWCDTWIDGQSYTLKLNTDYVRDFESTDFDGKEIVGKSYYQVISYALSEEFYNYLKSVNGQLNNNMGEVNLSPVWPTYTNIKGGFGLVGGCRMRRGDWMENVE